jgi:hypothetical protein
MRLTPDQVEAELERLDPSFRLTPTEQQQREVALRLEDAATWVNMVWAAIGPIADSYENGDLTLQDALRLVRRLSIACVLPARLQLLGRMVLVALTRSPRPRARGERRPPHSKVVRDVTAEFVLWLKEQHPDQRRSPTAYEQSSPLIDRAVATLTAIGWFEDQPIPQPGTVDDWVREREHARPKP